MLVPSTRFVASHAPNRERVYYRAKKVLDSLVHDTVALEGNPFTLPEVQTIIDGASVGKHRLSDHQQVVNQVASWRLLLEQVKAGAFRCDKDNMLQLHALVAYEEALTWGQFRDGAVGISGTDYRPPEHTRLNGLWQEGMGKLDLIDDAHTRAMACFLFISRNQFFYDGNKRTGRLMMNGILMSEGHDAITVPVARFQEFNEKMLRFYASGDSEEMIRFLGSCSLDEELLLEEEVEDKLASAPAP